MKRTMVAFMGVLWLALSVGMSAPLPEVYIRNKPFAAKVVLDQHTLHAPLVPLLQALGIPHHVTAEGIQIYQKTKPPADLSPASGSPKPQLFLDGKPLPVRLVPQGAGWLVPVRTFVEALNFQYRYNKETNIVDVVSGSRVAPRTPEGSGSGKPARTGAPSGNPDREAQVVKTEEVRGDDAFVVLVTVQNTGKVLLTNVGAQCTFTDGTRVIENQVASVGGLAPDQSNVVKFTLYLRRGDSYLTSANNIRYEIKLAY